MMSIGEGVVGSHVRQGKENHLHDGHLRYGSAQPYVEHTCGFPQWAVISAGEIEHVMIVLFLF